MSHYIEPSNSLVRIYTLSTQSRSVFKDQWFVPSLASLPDKFELIVSSDSRQKDALAYGSSEFNRVMETKTDLLVDAIRQCWRDFFIYSDVDVQFFQAFHSKIPRLIGDNDLVVQRDSPQGHLCAGFMILKADWPVLNLFQEIKLQLTRRSDLDDQAVLNLELIRSGVKQESRGLRYDELVTEAFSRTDGSFSALPNIPNQFGLKWNYLPPSFFGAGTESGKAWKPGDEILVPDDAIMHHANWTESQENKLAQLEHVRNKYQAKLAASGC